MALFLSSTYINSQYFEYSFAMHMLTCLCYLKNWITNLHSKVSNEHRNCYIISEMYVKYRKDMYANSTTEYLTTAYLQRLAVQFGALRRTRPNMQLAGAAVIVRHVHLIGVGELVQLAGANLLQERDRRVFSEAHMCAAKRALEDQYECVVDGTDILV